jgi:hypothetical protein
MTVDLLKQWNYSDHMYCTLPVRMRGLSLKSQGRSDTKQLSEHWREGQP